MATGVLALTSAACSGHIEHDTVYVRGGGSGGAGAGNAGGNGLIGGSGGTTGAAAGANAGGTTGTGGQHVSGDLLYVKASNPDAGDSFGSAIALDGSWMAVGAPNESSKSSGINGDQVDNSVDDSGAVYLFSDDGGWGQRAYLKASNTDATDGFGSAVSLSGDTLAVGALDEDSAATGIDGDQSDATYMANAGAVYVFRGTGSDWHQEAYVKASNTGLVDLFGTSVDLEGDRLVVGAPGEDSAATTIDGDQTDDSAQFSGAAYVFERTTSGWSEVAYLKGSYSEADDHFGMSVALSSDTIAVGAPWESSSQTGPGAIPTDNAALRSGAVYVFDRVGSNYQQTAFIKASNASADDEFGTTVALDGDTLAVGAPSEATSGGDGTWSNEQYSGLGAVYVFERSAGTWTQSAYLKPQTFYDKYWFGAAVAISGDTLVVGSVGDSGSTREGAAYVYHRGTSGWALDQRMTAPNAEINDFFGSAVAVTPTLMAVGAIGEGSDSPGINGDRANNDTPTAGATYLYRRR